MRLARFLVPIIPICIFFTSFELPAAGIQYIYDNLNRLEKVIYEDGTAIFYSYDEMGNRLTKTLDHLPYTPANPGYSGVLSNVAVNGTISWTGGDPDGDGVSYTLYLDTNSRSTTQVSSGQSATSYYAQGLSCGTTYYWSVRSADQYGAITNGPVWHFTTEGFASPAMIQRTGSTSTYPTLQRAYEVAVDGDFIMVQKVPLTESFRADRSISVTIDGGYDCTFSAKSGMTTIKGAPVISKGTVHMKNFRISN